MAKFLIILNLCFVFSMSNEADIKPALRIYPNEDEITMRVGSGLVLKCEIDRLGAQTVPNNDLKWLDKNGEEITDIQGLERSYSIYKSPFNAEIKLTFTKLDYELAGTYTCTGTVEGNRQSKEITIILYKDITFDHAPSPQFKVIYTRALIECRVSGYPSPLVSWIFKGFKLEDSRKYLQDINGLHINNITKHDEGIYFCEAELEGKGWYKTEKIEVYVQIPPKIDGSSLKFTGLQNYEFVISCRASGDPQPVREFYKDDNRNPIHTTDRKHYLKESGELVFQPLHEEDGGMYTCKAFNNAGEDVAVIELVVLVPPTIYGLPNITGEANASIELICLSHGNPAPTMSFRKAGLPNDFSLGENDGGRIFVTNPENGKLSLVIRKLLAEDMANYTCKSDNQGGFHEKNGTITVYTSPQFLPVNVRSLYIWPGKTRNITCQTISVPLASFDWVKYPSLPYAIHNNETYRIHIMGQNSNLQVTAREQDQNWIYGNYTCRATNHYGQSELIIELKKANLPKSSKNVLVHNVTTDSIILVPTPPDDDGGEKVISYRVDFESAVLMFSLNELMLIEGLRPSTSFYMQVRAVSEVGAGEPYLIVIKTEDIRVPYKPIITSSNTSSLPHKYAITWAKPITGGLSIKEIEIKFRKVKYKGRLEPIEDWNVRRRDSHSQPMTSYLLEGLHGNTLYQLEIKFRNDLGYSEPNDFFNFFVIPGPENGSNSLYNSYMIQVFALIASHIHVTMAIIH